MSQCSDIARFNGLVAQNMAELFAGGARDSGQRFLDLQTVRASDRRLQDPLANSAFLIDSHAEPEPVVRNLTSFYMKSESPWILWSAWPEMDFSAYGLRAVGDPPLMLRLNQVGLVVPPELEIREVITSAELDDFNRAFVSGYPVHNTGDAKPKLFEAGVIGTANRFWNGYVNEQCVAVSSATVFSGVLTVNCVATLESHRRRGYGAALTNAAARSAVDLPVLLLASDDGRPVYERLGFETISRFRLWHHS